MYRTTQLLTLQIPKGTPNPGESTAIDFSNPFELIVYIILPIIMVVCYLIWRKKYKKK